MEELQEDGQIITGIGEGKNEAIDGEAVKVLWSTGHTHLGSFEVIQDGVTAVQVKSPSPDHSLSGEELGGHNGDQMLQQELDINSDSDLSHQQGSVSEESHILHSDDITESQMLHVPESDGTILSDSASTMQVATSLASELAASSDQDVIQLLLPSEENSDSQSASLQTMSMSLVSTAMTSMPSLTSSPLVDHPTNTAQAITLSDGSTAFIQHPSGKFLEGQTLTLEDGSTAVVQSLTNKLNLVTSLPSTPGLVKADLASDSQQTQAVPMEDSTQSFINQAVKDGLQAIILEDGTTAYLASQTGFLETPQSLETSTLTLDQLTSGATPGSAVSGVTALLSSGMVNVDGKTLALHGQTVVTNGMDPQGATGVKTSLGTSNQTTDKSSPFVEKAYRCSYDGCGRYYTTLHHLRVHERSHTGDRPFRCEFNGCGKAFATGYGLKSHTRVHTGEKPYKCPHESCDKAFKTSGDLQKHVRTHTGERPFKCPFEGCSRSFTTSNIRKVHIRTHTGERPYICTEDGCGRAFASATNYKNHIRIHTGEKPYVCTVQGCGKRFTEYSSLYKHHVVHTHAKPYTCNRCGKTYRQTSTLAMHKRTAHGEDVTAESEAVLFQQQANIDGFELPPEKRGRLNFTLTQEDLQEEGDGALIINTSDNNPQQLTLVGADTLSAGTTNVLQNPALTNHALLQQAGVATFTLGDQGQQVYVITDPAQLEALQQIAQHQFDTEQLDNSLITSLPTADPASLEASDVTTVTEITPPSELADSAVVTASAGQGELQVFQPDT